MSKVRTIKVNRNGFKFTAYVNKDAGIVHALLKEFPQVNINISIGKMEMEFPELDVSETGVVLGKPKTNIIKTDELNIFTSVPEIRGIAVCNPEDIWNTSTGVKLAVDRAYSIARKVMTNSILTGIGHPKKPKFKDVLKYAPAPTGV